MSRHRLQPVDKTNKQGGGERQVFTRSDGVSLHKSVDIGNEGSFIHGKRLAERRYVVSGQIKTVQTNNQSSPSWYLTVTSNYSRN